MSHTGVCDTHILLYAVWVNITIAGSCYNTCAAIKAYIILVKWLIWWTSGSVLQQSIVWALFWSYSMILMLTFPSTIPYSSIALCRLIRSFGFSVFRTALALKSTLIHTDFVLRVTQNPLPYSCVSCCCCFGHKVSVSTTWHVWRNDKFN